MMTIPKKSNNEIARHEGTLPATPNVSIQPAWENPAAGLRVHVPGVFLGRLVGSDGWNAGYKDSHTQPVPDAGIGFVVSQSSAGNTSLSARPMTGYQVEALNLDASSRQTMWRSAPEWDDKVTLDSDSGKLLSLAPGTDFSDMNIGNPGVRAGVVRVTDAEGDQRHYIMAANFRGRDNDWHVSGEIREVWPNPELQEILAPRRAIAGNVIDPAVVSKELEPTIAIGAHTIADLATAFENATPGIHILHAPKTSAEAAQTFAEASLDLLVEIAKRQPAMLDGTEQMVDELGRRVRLFNRGSNGDTSNTARGYLDRLASDEENRVNYLEQLRGSVQSYVPSDRTAHHFSFFAKQALDILKIGFDASTVFVVPQNLPVLENLQQLIEADKRQTTYIQSQRMNRLRGSLLDPETAREGLTSAVAIPGQKVVIDLAAESVLLSADQTADSFYAGANIDAGQANPRFIQRPIIAFLTMQGRRYALVDTERLSYSPNDYQKPERSFSLLRIDDDGTEHPRYGQLVTEHRYDFGGTYDRDIKVISQPSKDNEQGYMSNVDDDVTLEFDATTGTVIIASNYRTVNVVARTEAVKTAPWQVEAGDGHDLEQRLKIRTWQKTVHDIERRTAAMREREAQRLAARIETGHMTFEDIARQEAEIKARLTRGVERSWTYNGYPGDKWHRSQTYYESVDEQGNVWGDFEAPYRIDYDVTGRPVSAGKHLLIKNPLNQ